MNDLFQDLEYPGAHFDRVWRDHVFPSDYKNPVPQDHYHLVAIGAGTAGLIVSIAAAGLGARVALVERQAMGGDCLNVGCVPSKALLEYVKAHGADGDFQQAFEWLRQVRSDISPHDSVARFSEAGVDVFLGSASFIDDRRLQVGNEILKARRFAICSGGRAAVPPIPGLAECDPLTNESVFDLRQRPESLAILGGGPIGCELAQAMAKLGVGVDLFEMAPRILNREDPQASELVSAALKKDGVNLHTGTAVEKIIPADGQSQVIAGDTKVTAERVLVALGRRANVDDLNLDAVGVNLEQSGLIKVDAKLRTSNPRIFAAGDVCTRAQFTHHADAMARIVVQNALFLPTASSASLVVPHCTYTQPELAGVGATARELESQGRAFDRYRVNWSEMDRARASGDTAGFAEVFTEKGKDRILGATVVGPEAGDLIAPISILMSKGLGLSAVSSAILSYPTRAEYLKRLADAYNRTRLTPLAQKLMGLWFRLVS